MKIPNIIKNIFGSLKNSSEVGSDHDKELESLFERVINEILGDRKTSYWYDAALGKSSAFKEIQKNDTASKKAIISYLISRVNTLSGLNKRDNNYNSTNLNRLKHDAYIDFLKGLLRRDLKLEDDEIANLLLAFKESDEKSRVAFSRWPVTYVVQQLERSLKKKPMSSDMKKFLKEVLKWRQINQKSTYWGSDIEKVKVKLSKMVFDAENQDGLIAPYLLPEDTFGIVVNDTINNLEGEMKNKFYGLFHIFLKASSSKPSQKFLKDSSSIIDEIGLVQYKKIIHSFLEVLISLKVTEVRHANGWVTYEFLKEKNNILVKGMIWSLSKFHDSKTLNLIAQTAERCFKKIPGIGPAAAAVGNACIYVLGNTKGLEGISQLSRLKLKIKQNSTRKLIEENLEKAANKMGVTTSEIEEISIPDFDLKSGRRVEIFEEYQFIIEIDNDGVVKSSWIKPDGQEQKSVPAFVKNATKLNDKLKKLKTSISKIKKYYSAQKDRIDRLYLDDRVWKISNLEKNYINHGLVCSISRKLIWEMKINDEWTSVYFKDHSWYDIEDKKIDIDPDTDSRLWHPCNVPTEEVLNWRNKLEDLQIKQPIKQAHREVYILTDAEINTKTYSNRMAAHILKQHQFNALANLRGWKYALMGAFDNGIDSEIATIYLKAHNMQAQFWINELNAEDAMNDTGIWNYIATDQVRFVSADREPIELVEIPPIIFSEIMRNVDLFVGVASVGNDPEWRDNGGLPQYRDYWTSYSFGDLNEIAKTRKVILESLLPRLKINKIAKIEGKYLVVKGKVRTYKIHIGSSNILMEPNDQYLCIVPDRKPSKTPNNIFLPFEGDRGLSLILSKAFLLADDDKVTDKTILSQIHNK